MLDFSPLATVYSSHNRLLLLVHAHSHDSHSVPPECLVLLEHLLIVLHGSLAGPTPSRPNINEKYLPCLVVEMSLTLIKDVINFTIVSEGASSR
jgi:hypothetical protein